MIPDSAQRFTRIQNLFHEALARPEAERDGWLREQCTDDPALLERIRTLLEADFTEQTLSETMNNARIDAPVPHRRLGPYEILSLLGRGGMGAVYLAQRADGQYERKVAIKLVDLPLATEAFFERFRLERQILAGLNHPGIARMLDGGISDDGILYLVMEYVNGVPLDEFCRTHTPSIDARLALFLKVCQAVQFAHQNLVIHRDLKPDNILVTGDGEPHLLDFGTATLLEPGRVADREGLTRQGFLSFTPAYASPEQVLGRPMTTATDTYSLGVLLYLLLTNHLPYQLNHYTTEEMVQVICEKPPLSPRSEDNTFPDADLEAILAKALRKEPEQRYQTAEQLAGDVEAYLNHRPLIARKGTLRYTTGKFARRNRLAIAFAGVLCFTLLAGIVAVAWQAHAARRAERTAEARSNDLLGLSDSLLTELDGTIQQLPGSTGVQQVLVARVLERLETLPPEVRTDRHTAVTLANAYVRLANLQGDPYEQNLGDVAGGARDLEKATALLAPLLAQSPKDTSLLLAMAEVDSARGEILSSTDPPKALASLNASAAIYTQLLARPAQPPNLYQAAGSVEDIMGDILGEDTGFSDGPAAAAQYRKAIAFDQQALAIQPDYWPVRRGLVLMQLKLGNVDLDVDPAVALREFRAAVALENQLSEEQQNLLSNRRLRGLLLRKQAAALAELGVYDQADELFRQAHEVYGAIAAADPKDLRARRDLELMMYVELGAAEAAANRLLAQPNYDRHYAWKRAAEIAAQRLALLHELLVARPTDQELRLAAASTEVREATAQAESRGIAFDRSDVARDLDLLQAESTAPLASPEDLELIYLAYSSLPDSAADARVMLHCAQRAVDLTHHRGPDWLLALALAQKRSGQQDEARSTARQGLDLLPPSSPENRTFRVRRLLEAILSS